MRSASGGEIRPTPTTAVDLSGLVNRRDGGDARLQADIQIRHLLPGLWELDCINIKDYLNIKIVPTIEEIRGKVLQLSRKKSLQSTKVLNKRLPIDHRGDP
jgi:hypothetical protein